MNRLNTARTPYIKHDFTEVKEVVNFAESLRYVLELKITKLRTAMQKSDNHFDADMAMISIQALEWTQGRIQDTTLNNVTTDCIPYTMMTNRITSSTSSSSSYLLTLVLAHFVIDNSASNFFLLVVRC
jgi:hypothetical protein